MVRYGIDALMERAGRGKLFGGRRIGLITAPTGLDINFRPTVDLLAANGRLSALFAPEHGVRGDAGAGESLGDTVDEATKVPVYSLYRKESKRLSEEMLGSFDVLVYDIQDVGSRYYTFLYTLLYAIEDCAKAGKEVVVLDRPNPLGGEIVEGNIIKDEYFSFVGGFPLCMRYGLTVGEYAAMVRSEKKLDFKLEVVRCEGWQRGMLWRDTGLQWVLPSPGLPSFNSALLYCGTCLFEGSNLSEGRGTALPFEIIGAPYINDAPGLARAMNAKNLPGLRFRPLHFIPSAGKHAGSACGGVQIHVLNPAAARPVEAALNLMYEIEKRWPGHFEWCTPLPPATRPHIELLGGSADIMEGKPLEELLAAYAADEKAFAGQKAGFHMY